MQRGKVFSLSLSAIVAVSLTSGAHAITVYGTAASLTGDRAASDGELIIVDSRNSNWDDGIVEWNIVQDGPNYDYTYTFWNFQQPAISHLTLDLTDDAVNDANAVTNVRINGTGVAPADLLFGNYEGIIGAIKIDDGDDETYEDRMILTFSSNRAPVWGDFSIEVGQEQSPAHFLVQNAGFGDQTLSDVSQYIARPNGAVVPAPAAATAGVVLLGGLVLRRRRAARSAH